MSVEKQEFTLNSCKADSGELSVIQTMFKTHGETRSMDLFTWQYLGVLNGTQVVIASDPTSAVGEGAALVAAFSNPMLVNGKPAVGAQAFDTLTLESYRGNGLFVQLATKLYESMISNNTSVLFGIPNAAAYPGWTKHLGWNMIDPLPLIARPIGLRYVRVKLKLRKPTINSQSIENALVQMVSEVPKDVTDLFDNSIGTNHTGVIRNYEYLQWRLSRPGSSYRLFEIRGKGGELLAFGVYELLLKHGCALGYVMDLIVNRNSEKAGRILLRHMIKEMKHRGADLVFAWSMPGSFPRAMYSHSKFLPFPSRIRPVELHLGYKTFGDLSNDFLKDRSDFGFSYLDSDTV
jgi:hypothetical protein